MVAPSLTFSDLNILKGVCVCDNIFYVRLWSYAIFSFFLCVSNRRDAFTCWSSSSGAEQFNYGSRIDHILVAGPCLHEEGDQQGHSFLACHVKECDILTEYKRFKNETVPTR